MLLLNSSSSSSVGILPAILPPLQGMDEMVVGNLRGEISNDATATKTFKKDLNLCKECQNTVRYAPFMDLEYEDVSNFTILHETTMKRIPFPGGRDLQGNWGYVYDVTALSRNPPKFHFNAASHCDIHDQDWEATKRLELSKGGGKGSKILCVVYASEPYHANLNRIRKTWGPKCDGFFRRFQPDRPNSGCGQRRPFLS
jgi:hypothetical protein